MHDVVVIGGGSGGYAAAIRAAQLGAKAVVVEAAEIGGTCVNRGCIPTKIWIHAAGLLHRLRTGKDFGIHAAIEKIDLNTIVERKNGVASEIRMGMEGLLRNNGVEILRGRAVLKSPREVDVEGTLLETRNIIIATGSSLTIPDIPGLAEAALTTDQVLDMTDVPSSVLIFGSGFIEVEMAFLLNSFGCKVVLAAESRRLLPGEDGDTSQRIAQAMREQGIQIITRCTLQSVKQTHKGFECLLAGQKEQRVEVAKVLVATRKPNVTDMGLEQAGVRLNDGGGIRVDEKLQTGVKEIFAIGDATGGWMLSHAASSMAIVAAENAMGMANVFPFHLIPRGIWSFPEIGAVGLSEEEAEKQGFEIEIGDFPYSINGLAMAKNEVSGAVKIISESRYGEILGVHIVGGNATELVGEAVLAMQLEATAKELARSIRVHPTFSESVVDAARDAADWALYLPKR